MSSQLTKAQSDRLKNLAACTSISVAVILCLLKIFGAFVTDSLAVLSSMVDMTLYAADAGTVKPYLS